MHATSIPANPQVASDAQLQRHDLLIELYRLDQAAELAAGSGQTDDLARIERARTRIRDILAQLPA